MKTTDWLIVDTETDGLMDPIHVVEIAAQRMRGWEPVGEKFRVLLNHNVPIPSAAVALHGYTQEFLRRNGVEPLRAHASFRNFAGDLPIVTHNLSFDWNRALYPEWARLGLPPIGRRGFCTLMLSRRLVDETKSYSLDALRQTFDISSNFSHRAFADVHTLVTLFGQVFRPRLEGSGITSFGNVLEFSCKTPVAKCLSAVRSRGQESDRPGSAKLVGSWYFIDAHDQTHGPLPAREILSFMSSVACWIWREGLPDWVSSDTNEEFLQALRSPPPLPAKKPRAKRKKHRTMVDLLDVCNAILADGTVTTEEVVFLSNWLQEAGVIKDWPWTEIADTIERIMADGLVTDEERNELQTLLRRVNSGSRDAEAGRARQSRSKSRPTTPPEDSPHQVNRGLEIRIACGCGQRLLLDSEAAGQEFQCPACGATLRVPGVPQAHSTPPPTVMNCSVAQPQSFTLVQLTQGTPEWLKWRNDGIGASDAPIVMGESPWKTPRELLEQKCGLALATEVNAAMARGTALEPEARQAYISRTGKWMHPACLQSTAYDWLRASVDGITPALDALLEIKCGQSVYRTTSETGCVPDYYYGQLQHIMAVTGLQSMDFWCYLPGLPELLVPVARDDRYIARLLEAEYQFWTQVVRSRR